MSKIALSPDGGGTGTFTLASPNSNTSRTLTLPDAAGELLTSTGDGSSLSFPTGLSSSGQVISSTGDVNLKTTTELSDVAATITAAQMKAGVFTITPTVARIQTTDTAVNIIAGLTGSVTGSNYKFTIVNLAAFDVTITGGTGVTIVGNGVVKDGSATWMVVQSGASTVDIYRVEGSAAAPSYSAAVNFNGYLSVTVNSSTNVASVVRNAVGDYTVTFTTAMPNTNYLWFVLVPDRPGASAGFGSGVNNLRSTKAVGSIRFKTGYTGNSANTDGVDISVLIISL